MFLQRSSVPDFVPCCPVSLVLNSRSITLREFMGGILSRSEAIVDVFAASSGHPGGNANQCFSARRCPQGGRDATSGH